MAHRIDRNETNYSSAKKLAWNYILPYMHTFILDSDTTEAYKLTKYLEKVFSKQALTAAVKRIDKE